MTDKDFLFDYFEKKGIVFGPPFESLDKTLMYDIDQDKSPLYIGASWIDVFFEFDADGNFIGIGGSD